jgi:membrane protein implicated in regulation of membrane protease activity
MDWLRDNLWQAWLGVAILLGVAEMFSLDLILIMLAIGAGVGMLAAMLELPIAVQVLAASGASVAMLGLVRPSAVRRLRQGPSLELGHGKLVGQRAIVTESISTHQVGRIKLAGEIWSAQAYDEHVTIGPGETVEVLQIKGATAVVLPVPSLES